MDEFLMSDYERVAALRIGEGEQGSERKRRRTELGFFSLGGAVVQLVWNGDLHSST